MTMEIRCRRLTSAAVFLLPFLFTGEASGFSPTASVQVTTPQRYSLSIGVCSGDYMGVLGTSSGLLARIEPGISGGKLHLGFRSMFSFLFIPVTSTDVTGAVLQTWNDPWGGVEEGGTYLGGEIRLGLRVLLLTAGVYKRVAGEGDEGWISSFGAGLGL